MALFATVVCLVLLAVWEPVLGDGSGGPHWDYDGMILSPCQWQTHYRNCGGRYQSPINIDTPYVRPSDKLQDFNLEEYSREQKSVEVLNNGHTVEVSFADSGAVTISGGSLGGAFVLDQLHFHWGSTNYKGSEHKLNGKAAPPEMHIVHHHTWNHEHLVVLSFLFQISDGENKDFEDLLKVFEEVTYRDQTAEMEGFRLSELLPENAGRGNYFRYRGSLTTPPCNETVLWTVFEEKIEISEKQLEVFRSLQAETRHDSPHGDHPLWDNFRHTQPLNDRQVWYKGSSGHRSYNPSYGGSSHYHY